MGSRPLVSVILAGALVAGGCAVGGGTSAGSHVGSSRSTVTSAAPAPDKAKYLAFLHEYHTLRIQLDEITAKLGHAENGVYGHASTEQLHKAGDVFAEEAPKMQKVAGEMAAVNAPPDLKNAYDGYVANIRAYAKAVHAMAQDAHAGKGSWLGDLYGYLDNRERPDFKDKLIAQLRVRGIWVPPWIIKSPG